MPSDILPPKAPKPGYCGVAAGRAGGGWGDLMQKRRMKATAAFVLATAFSLVSGANLDAQSFTEEAMPLTTALDGAVPYLIGRIPAGAKVRVLNFTAESPALSNYLVDEITARLVNSNNFIVVDRRRYLAT
jgi:hypothetical protein